MLEEANDAGQLFDGNLGEDARRILQIRARLGEQGRHLLFARDQRTQTIVGGREFALHQREGSVGAGAGVVVGILRPGANGLEGQQPRVDLAQHHFAGRRAWSGRARTPGWR